MKYHKHYFNRHVVRGNVTYWRCSQFAIYKCRARLKSINDSTVTVLNADHNHDVINFQRKYGTVKELKRQIREHQTQQLTLNEACDKKKVYFKKVDSLF